ncbi:hypothetical protein [Nocardia niwae]|uniref:Uncharacterized protein n=1 Tax=Nocardia niwae TaxID=626084 RepID=A0ABV2XFR3_9NOCA
MGGVIRMLPVSAQAAGQEASGVAALPAPERLLAAIAGHLELDSPLIGWALVLGDLHAALLSGFSVSPRYAADSDEAAVRRLIAEVVEQVDSWAVSHRHVGRRTQGKSRQ